MALEWLGYIELIDRFTFREKCSISIPKRVRERAFSLQLDIEIVSTDGNDYENSKSIPAYGFFGYAVLVFRNYAEIQIPINQARQRLYYGRVAEAYANWYQLFLWQAHREWTKGLAELLGQFGTALDLGEFSVPSVPCIPWSGFEELPLREAYIKCRKGTQFRLEISRWEAVTRSGDTDCDYEPISRQTDDSNSDGTGRDDGLPPTGSQPQNAPDPDNPFDGLDPPSTASELGEYGSNKVNSVDNPNPDNAPFPEGQGSLRWMKVTARVKRPEFLGGCSTTRIAKDHYLVLDTTQLISLTPNAGQGNAGCGQVVQLGGWKVQLTGGTPFDIGNSDSAPEITFERGNALPSNELYFE